MNIKDLSAIMDHTLLHPTAGIEELKKECAIAIKYQTAALCVKPCMVLEAKKILYGSGVNLCTVIGFPSGNATVTSKAFEAADAARNGAKEVDMVINVAKALEGDWAYLEGEISAVARACHENEAIVKVIIETDYLTSDEQIVELCEICAKTGADYIKTSTGFGYKKNAEGNLFYTGATIKHVKLMKDTLGERVKVKASGGVRDLDSFLALMELGVERIGLSATESIIEEAKVRFEVA